MAKLIVPTGKMSNLVKMVFQIWQDEKLTHHGWVIGKADDEHYLVQFSDFLMGQGNVIKIVNLKDMLEWDFYENNEMEIFAYEKWADKQQRVYRIKPFKKVT